MVYSGVSDESAATKLAELRHVHHPDCILCGFDDGLGLGLDFVAGEDGSVTAEVDCDEFFQSYPGLLHGGIIALLLDGAMTNCLFAAGVAAVTAEMTVRYVGYTTTVKPLRLTARRTKSRPPLHLIEAEVWQGGAMVARASGKFIERSTDGQRLTGT